MIRQKGILISILNQYEIHKDNVENISMWALNDRYKMKIEYPTDKPISNNRNKIVQRFLAMKDYDYLLMIDDDVVPTPNILDLLDFDKDIITPVMFTRHNKNVYPLVMDRTKDGKYRNRKPIDIKGLMEVDATGTGCMFIKREVLEHPALKHPFKNHYDADGIKTTGLDFNFCTRAKKVGFKVWVHGDYVAGHYTLVDLKDVYEDKVLINSLQEELVKKISDGTNNNK
jgi:hypothetical protein